MGMVAHLGASAHVHGKHSDSDEWTHMGGSCLDLFSISLALRRDRIKKKTASHGRVENRNAFAHGMI
jgi:hypothetical protein